LTPITARPFSGMANRSTCHRRIAMLNPHGIFLELFIELPSQKSISRNPLTLKQEFQCELNLTRGSRRLDLAEGG
jgi:hypothetical protein